MLSEATQSQQVRRDSDSKSAMFGTKAGKKVEDANVKKKMKTALILFEDVDLVFDDLDEGFYSAVNTLSQQSKRPIIMTTASSTWLGCGSIGEKHLKFSPKVITLEKVDNKQLCQHLQTIALIEGYHVSKSDIERVVNENSRDVRKSLLQIQLQCNSGLNPIDSDDHDTSDGDDDNNVNVKAWFKHLDNKTRRSGVSAPVSTIDMSSRRHGNGDWWSLLPGEKLTAPLSTRKYPLTLDDVPKQVFSRIDPLKNKDLFDDGGSDEETVVKEINSDKTEISKVEKVSLSKKQRERNYKSLQTMSQHLDTISCFNSDKDSPGWHALKPVVDGTSKNLPRFRDDVEEVETLKGHYSREISRLSHENVVKTFDEYIETHELRKIDKEGIWKEDQSVFFSGLVDIFLTDRQSC